MLLLNKETISKLRQSAGLRGKICGETGRAYTTVQRWAQDNDVNLTTASVLKVLRNALNLKDEEMLVEVDLITMIAPGKEKRVKGKPKTKSQ